MQVSSALIENIGQDEIKRFLRRRGIGENKTGQDFLNWLSDLMNTDSLIQEFEQFCYYALMYGKRKFIRSYEIKNTRVLKNEDLWFMKLKKEFHIDSLDFNDILKCHLDAGDEWKIAAIKTFFDTKGELEKISILFQCYVCKNGNVESCTYIPMELDLKDKILLIKSWRRIRLESEQEYKYNFLMDKVFKWLENNLKIEIKKCQFNYKSTLSCMNESLIKELLDAIPASRELGIIRAYFPVVESEILQKINFENKYIENGKEKIPENIVKFQNELNNLVTRAIVSDYFFKRSYDCVWDMGLSAIVNSVKLSELDNSITIVKSENNNKPVFCGKPFLMLLGAMENSKQVDTLCISFTQRGKKFRVSYDATKTDYITIGILSGQEDFCENDFRVIWEMLKQYEKRKDISIEKMVRKAIGE